MDPPSGGSEEHHEPPSSDSAGDEGIVPEVLLSVAKDDRYLEQCRTHLSALLRAAVASTGDRADGADCGGVAAASQLLSGALYALLVLHRRRRSLGQEALGLGYGDNAAWTALRRWRLPVAWLAASAVVFLLRRRAGNNTTGTTSHGNRNEMLRGRERRAIFELQRQRMTARGATADGDEAAQHRPRPRGQTSQGSVVAEPLIQAWCRCVPDIAGRIAASLAGGLSVADSEGPHAAESGRSADMSRSFCAWLIRLHWAWYCVNGTYPTLMHRVFRLRQCRQESAAKDAQLVQGPRRTARTVGLLILVQAIATLVPSLLIRLVQWWDDAFAVPGSLPPAVRFGEAAVPGGAATEGEGDSGGDGHQSHCAICRRTRRHPACSVRCGHVFCWACLQQWVQSYEACPMCRVECRAQDVLSLRSYAPPEGLTRLEGLG